MVHFLACALASISRGWTRRRGLIFDYDSPAVFHIHDSVLNKPIVATVYNREVYMNSFPLASALRLKVQVNSATGLANLRHLSLLPTTIPVHLKVYQHGAI
jgi:hypothetical protein